MESHLRVGRAIPLNAIQTAAAVLGVRREITGSAQRWTLGAYGSFELDGRFEGLTLSAQTRRGDQRVRTSGRLWSPDGMAVVAVEIALESALAPPTQVSITPILPLPPTFAEAEPNFRALAFAALSEFCEELLFHAASLRAGAVR